MVFLNRVGILTNENIAAWSDEAAEKYTEAAGKRAYPGSKTRLAMEELLLKFRAAYGEDAECRVVGRKFLGQISYQVYHAGDELDPVAPEEDLQASYDILVRLGIRPRFAYLSRRRLNRVTLPCDIKPLKNKMLIEMSCGVVLAVALFFLFRALPAGVGDTVYNALMLPVFNKLTSIIAAIATPLVFLSVITGIASLGDAASFGKIGSRFCGAMGMTYLVAAVVLGIASLIGYPVVSGAAAEGEGILRQIVQLVLDMVPDNLIEPFAVDNDLQVITIAIFVGVIMLFLGDQLRSLGGLIHEASSLINRMMAAVCKLLPLVVFVGIFNLLWGSNVAELVPVYKTAIYFLVCSAVIITVSILRTRAVTKLPFRIVFKKVLPTLMINLTTSSQVAALPENMHCCKDKFGIEPKIVDFALPLGIVIFMPCGAAFLGLMAISLANLGGAVITVSTFIKVIIVSVILAIAAPPIPGSVFAVLPILFAACNIPDSMFPLAIVVGSILGYLLPAFNGFLLQLELLMTAIKMKKIDLNVLADPTAGENE